VLPRSPIMESSIFISTRITTTNEFLKDNCSLFDEHCTYQSAGNLTVYPANIEQFTIMFDHSMYVPSLNIQATSSYIQGTLLGQDMKPMALSSPDQFGQIGRGMFDILQLGTILKAAGINSLDSPGESRQYLTKRYEGLIVLLFIDYSNMFSYNLANIQYFARAAIVDNAYFKMEEPIYAGTSLASRVIWNRHGTRIIVLQTGSIGAFDFPTGLISFVSGLGLVALATLIVDTLATKILPQKKIYNQYKYAAVKGSSERTPFVTVSTLPETDLTVSQPQSESFDEYGTFGRKFDSHLAQ